VAALIICTVLLHLLHSDASELHSERLSGIQAYAFGPKTMDGSFGFGPRVNGLRSMITLAKVKFSVGEPIDVKYVVKNVSSSEQTIWHSGFWPNHMIIVKMTNGKEPPLTDFGREGRAAFAPRGARTKNFALTLSPDAEDATQGAFDLTRIFDLSDPGLYTLQYVYEERQGGWEGRLPSNVLTFRVVATRGTAP